MTAFNSFHDEGRVTTVLLHAQHACEMLLKAVLVQNKQPVFEKNNGMSIGTQL
ncbi:HEPN domain-containing protein [Paracoccus sp. J39]|uniref:HEPN domain-containing protein n=1 Tax=Paracoccus sp. J39 TaxID=935848 RepID=UPI0018DC3856|nr:HEPN domain-containing protein [Paracoccus sp. J39]